jgi:thioredoxin-dependent peroxiredoxin
MLWKSICLVRTTYEVRLNVWIFTFTFLDCWVPECERENVIFTGVQFCKDDTPGCTKEACNFRDSIRAMQKRGIIVLGVSADSVESHQKFADKYDLNFPLLADTDTSVSQLYDVWKEKNFAGKNFMGVNRSTFLIDKDGIVRKIWHKVKPDEHAGEVLQAVDALGL